MLPQRFRVGRRAFACVISIVLCIGLSPVSSIAATSNSNSMKGGLEESDQGGGSSDAEDSAEDGSSVEALDVETTATSSKISELMIGVSTNNTILIKSDGFGSSYKLSDGNIDGTAPLEFDSNTTEYTLSSVYDTGANYSRLKFCVSPESSNATITLDYTSADGTTGTETITASKSWYSSVTPYFDFLTPGVNKFSLTVSVPGAESTVYSFTINCIPTLNSLSASISGESLSFDSTFSSKTFDYSVSVPSDATTVDFSAVTTASSKNMGSDYTVTYNGSTSSSVDITGVDSVEIAVTAGTGEAALTSTYNVAISNYTLKSLVINTTPDNAVVQVYDQDGNLVEPENGAYSGNFGNGEYTYTVSLSGYKTESGTVPTDGGALDIVLEKVESSHEEVDAEWPSYRGDDSNMAIVDIETPTGADSTELLWAKGFGSSDWNNAPTPTSIIDNSLVTVSGTHIYKLDLSTGEVLASGTTVSSPNWGMIQPVYGDGMIYVCLSGGVVQAFDAQTLESVWVYRDPLGGQSVSQITYSDGYVYTGFWNSETSNANFVCISVTDEDTSKTDETKSATWTLTSKGGFYCDGAVAIGEDYIVVGTSDDSSSNTGNSRLLCLDKVTGKIVSSLDTVGDIRCSIAYDEESGRVWFTSSCGYLYRADIDTSTGELSNLKSANLGSYTRSTPVVYKGTVYLGTGGSGDQFKDGYYVGYDAETLTKKFSLKAKGNAGGTLLLSTAYESEGYLYLYGTYNNTPGGISMIKVPTDGGTPELIELYDASAHPEYCISSIIASSSGVLYYKNDSGYIMAVGEVSADSVERLIDNIGEVTIDSGSAITAARNAYDSLSDTLKSEVSNYSDLVAAEKEYAEIVADINKVENAIEALPSPNDLKLSDASAVNAAKKAYDSLSSEEKASISDELVAKLNSDIKRLAKLELLASASSSTSSGSGTSTTSGSTVSTSSVVATTVSGGSISESAASSKLTDEATGLVLVGAQDGASLKVTQIESGEDVWQQLADKVGGYDIISFWDISLVDSDGNEIDDHSTMFYRIKAPDTEGYQALSIARYNDNGTVDYIECKVEDGYLTWSTTGTGRFALVGSQSPSQALSAKLPTDGSGFNILPWAIAGCVAVAALVIVLFARRRRDDEAQGER
ncbi:MAG: PQQ-binding-like beta-propeller repeat protein [Coriobacteriales bacterium]|jgi:hypothetical protein